MKVQSNKFWRLVESRVHKIEKFSRKLQKVEMKQFNYFRKLRKIYTFSSFHEVWVIVKHFNFLILLIHFSCSENFPTKLVKLVISRLKRWSLFHPKDSGKSQNKKRKANENLFQLISPHLHQDFGSLRLNEFILIFNSGNALIAVIKLEIRNPARQIKCKAKSVYSFTNISQSQH